VRRTAVLLVLLAGCGNHDVTVAPDCTESVAAVKATVAHSGPLAGCFQHAASSADVQALGANVIETAHELADEVRKAPHSHAAVELGYLVGVVRQNAKGVHYETGRRVEQELIGLPTDTPEFRRGLASAGVR
jgi:acyl-CoA synthetase (NDP forming)